jgi:hypothetical protein
VDVAPDYELNPANPFTGQPAAVWGVSWTCAKGHKHITGIPDESYTHSHGFFTMTFLVDEGKAP